MQPSSIQWTQFTSNPFRARRAGLTVTKGGYNSGVGHYCEKVSPGCKHCYSSSMQPRFGLPQFQEQRGGGVESFLDVSKLRAVLSRRAGVRIFWCDMTDMFGDWVPDEWIAACFGVMAATPQHTHQVLTKRPDRARAWFSWLEELKDDTGAYPAHVELLRRFLKKGHGIDARAPSIEWPLPNVHLGVSVEDRARIPRIDVLRTIPAAVRFVSFEPLIEDVGDVDLTGIGWGIIGGESGHSARTFDVDWGRSLVRQLRAAGARPFVKQLGARPYGGDPAFGGSGPMDLLDGHGGDPAEWPDDLRVREFPEAR